MALMFELSGEDPNLPREEILGALQAEGIVDISYRESPGVLIVDGGGLGPSLATVLSGRLALTKRISEFVLSSPLDGVVERSADAITLDSETFCIRARTVQGLHDGGKARRIERGLGEHLSRQADVDLEEADIEIRVVLSREAHVGKVLTTMEGGSFEPRKVKNRPFFSPISLHPRLARCLVNLSRTPPGGGLLDPFCGTGGILIEAGLMGMTPLGCDISTLMVEGAGRNLEWAGVNDFHLMVEDVGRLPQSIERSVNRGGEWTGVNAVATDPPYGRAASTHGEELNSLYRRCIEAMEKILGKGDHMAMVLPEGAVEELGIPEGGGVGGFGLVTNVPDRVHGSLTRCFIVLRRQ